jgi:hypothetical protein
MSTPTSTLCSCNSEGAGDYAINLLTTYITCLTFGAAVGASIGYSILDVRHSVILARELQQRRQLLRLQIANIDIQPHSAWDACYQKTLADLTRVESLIDKMNVDRFAQGQLWAFWYGYWMWGRVRAFTRKLDLIQGELDVYKGVA